MDHIKWTRNSTDSEQTPCSLWWVATLQVEMSRTVRLFQLSFVRRFFFFFFFFLKLTCVKEQILCTQHHWIIPHSCPERISCIECSSQLHWQFWGSKTFVTAFKSRILLNVLVNVSVSMGWKVQRKCQVTSDLTDFFLKNSAAMLELVRLVYLQSNVFCLTLLFMK